MLICFSSLAEYVKKVETFFIWKCEICNTWWWNLDFELLYIFLYVFINGDLGISTNEFSVLGILGLSFLYIFES